MSEAIDTPEGYKKTKVGLIPIDWKISKLGNLVNIQSGNSPNMFDLENGGTIPYIKVEDLNNSIKYQITSRYQTNISKGAVPSKSILFPKRGAAILNNKVRISKVPVQMDSNMMAIYPKADSLDPEYLYYKITFQKLFRIADTSTIPQINNKHILPYNVSLPPLPEQQKIAEILSTWDKAISITQKLINELKLRNKGLLQQLLTGKKRLKGFEKDWKESNIGKCAQNMNIRNKGIHRTDRLYAVTKKDGMIPMREHVKGSDFDNCKIVRNNWFAYNPMRINIGSIALWTSSEEIMVSGDYVVFKCDETKLLPQYLEHLRKTILWENYMLIAGNGSVRIRIYFKELAHLKFPLPPLNEQKAILDILDKADKELQLYQQQLTILKEQKKGLMQKLLTGKIRTV